MYSTRAFAELTGVTVKALRHYERMGLLGPMRTRARYRRYAFADLQQNRAHPGAQVARALAVVDQARAEARSGRTRGASRVLEDRRARLNRAIAALHEIQEDTDPRAALQRFMTDAAWDGWEAKRQRVGATARAPESGARVRPRAVSRNRGRPRSPPSLQATSDLLAPDGRRWPTPTRFKRFSRAAVKSSLPEQREAWSRRAAWPAGLRRYAASCYEMEPDAWARVVGFIDGHGTR